MPYLEQERIHLQAELQAAIAEESGLAARLATQQQAVTAAQAQVGAAQTGLAQRQAEVVTLEEATNEADSRVADLDQQILDASEPEPGVPPAEWRRLLAALRRQREQARAGAAATHARLDAGQAAVAQARAAVQAAERRVSDAQAAVVGTQTAVAEVRARQQALQQQIANIAQVNVEIDRDPIDRKTVEQLAAELSVRVFDLEDAYVQASLEQEDAEELLRGLIARRDDLTQRIADATTRLPDAQAKLESAQRELAEAEADITAVFEEGPL
jgi:chromosome segregation ATPase